MERPIPWFTLFESKPVPLSVTDNTRLLLADLNSIAISVEETVKEFTGVDAWHKDGYRNSIWILLDYGDIMVHVFQKEARDFYNLEGLWADAKTTKIKDEN